jgi:hypothetical protein
MKHVPAILLVGLGLAIPVHAQWTVYDPAVHNQMIVSTAQEVAKFVEMINNQVKQLQSLTDQANTLHHYVDLFGNPASVTVSAVGPLAADLRKPELGRILGDIEASVSGVRAMTSDGGGLFHPVEAQFRTPEGAVVVRRERTYRPVAAVQDATANYLAVSKDTTARRATIKAEIATASEGIKAAKTDAEVQKLTAVLAGLHAALAGTDQELHQAAASVLVQDAANRADERRQGAAKLEQKRAEFTEGIDRYGRAFRLWSTPVSFPTR